MEIAELGEFGLIRRLTEQIELKNPETKHGVGDDCAVLEFEAGRQVLVTTDLLLEGVHFDLQYMPLKHLGYKSAIANLSDIYAMNGRPRQMTVSLGLSKRFTVEDMEEFYAGYRNGAKDTDLICVTGDLGAAYMGLQLLEREKSVYNQQLREAQQRGEKLDSLPPFQPDFSGREYLLERQLKPEARKDIIEALAKEGLRPTAMMDISDGLSSELHHICTQSHTGCRIYEERLPLDYQTAVLAEELNMNVTTCALNGGEDYELLFTVPLTEHDRIVTIPGVKVIGHITKPELGLQLVCRDGVEMELKAQGWKAI